MKPLPIIAILLLSACEAEAPLPDDVLDRERFTEVMVGMTLLEARMSQEMMVVPADAPPMALYCKELYAEHGIDSAAFRRSFDHYAMRPEEMKAVYDDVVERLRRMKDGWPQPAAAKDTALATDSSSGRN
ncbi:MAG: DUF4296 domain-containing protein [Flavobacteriales bacterium]|jgi:hypothetical protein|nr:DUF4296 domain-containing protein [Flavobacteriales bacterium]